MKITRSTVFAFAALLVGAPDAQPQGLLGQALGAVGLGEAGRALDDAHRQLKEALPPYRALEEGTSGATRQILRESSVETAGPVLAGMIEASRADALRGGVSPMPRHIFEAFLGFYDASFLEAVRFRIGQGGELSLQANAFRFGDRDAITLGSVIVFRSVEQAQSNIHLWAHELAHVAQYLRWGILDFAKRYVRDYGAVEAEAEQSAERFLTWRARLSTPAPAPPGGFNPMVPGAVGGQGLSNACRALRGVCFLNVTGPIGTPCYCATPWGPEWGLLVP